MSVSVIVPTFNRAELLRLGILSSLATENYPNLEVVIVNDGTEDDGTLEVCQRFKHLLNIKYVYTGKRNNGSLKWRVPGFAINVGVKKSSGSTIIISCPEMFLLDKGTVESMVEAIDKGVKAVVITNGKDDYNGHGLNAVKRDLFDLLPSMYDSMFELHTEYPFFLGMLRKDYFAIGGYDEDFVGYAYDDTNFTLRLKNYGANFFKLKKRVIHLYHPRGRGCREGLVDYDKEIEYNKRLYHERDKDTVANLGREWGVLND